MNKKYIPYLFLLVLTVIAFSLRNCNSSSTNSQNEKVKTPRGLNRNPAKINYSKHAICRMDCREITEQEVKQVLREGKINYSKSDLKQSDCTKRYVVDGYSKDKQHIRIVVVPCSDEITVITCIDLDRDWVCNCEGDN